MFSLTLAKLGHSCNQLIVCVSVLSLVFGIGKKREMAPTTGEAFLELRKSEEMLIRKQEFLEEKIKQVVITMVPWL